MYLWKLTKEHAGIEEPYIAIVSGSSEEEARLLVIQKLAEAGNQEAGDFALSSTKAEQIGEANGLDYGTVHAIESTDFIGRKLQDT
jgi:hypothetical protein